MSTYREVISMVLDELKVNSDDSYFTEDHIAFLIDKYRDFLISQKYKNEQIIPSELYQTICIPIVEVTGELCDGVHYLKSKKPIPPTMGIGDVFVNTYDYIQNIHITFVPIQRMRYVGENKYLKNIIYCAIDPEKYLVFKSMNPQAYYLEFVRMTAVFPNSIQAYDFKCEDICDTYDKEIPIESGMVPQVIEFIVKELTGAVYKKEDVTNNAQDELKTEA